MPGPVALVGSGEFLEGMRATDRRLLEGRPQRAVFLPTAAAEEGPDRIRYWLDLGTSHYESLGVEAVPLAVLTREDADSDWAADVIPGAGLVYLSGGDPGYLADTLRDTAVWAAIERAWQNGAAVAGCSAGACALSAVANHVRSRTPETGKEPNPGLGLVPHLAVIPHFDYFRRRAPQVMAGLMASAGESLTTVGIDEDTALVGGPVDWVVEGRSSVSVFAEPSGSGALQQAAEFSAGDEVSLPPRS